MCYHNDERFFTPDAAESDEAHFRYATNSATAEALILALDRGDLAWRDIVIPENRSLTI